ncbi:MAG: PDZ domain-containing protein [Actinobacteria bacterium]|nr:PDZ domain-containing protein [Actinomycetota bacterium]
MDTLLVIFWGIVLLATVVFIHELGHFLSARAFGVRVTEFMIGLPGPSIGFTKWGTRFGVTAIPLGGYARVAGMESGPENIHLKDALAYVYRHGSTDEEHLAAALDIDVSSAQEVLIILSGWGSIVTPKNKLVDKIYLAPADGVYVRGEARVVEDPQALIDEQRKGTYRALPFWKRICVLFAGPLTNIFVAVLALVLLLSAHGVWLTSTTLDGVAEGSPAAMAGIVAEDKIVAIDGTAVEDWEGLSVAIEAYDVGDTVDVTYVRDGEETTVPVKLYEGEYGPALGIYAGTELVHLSIIDSLKESFNYIGMVVVAIGGLFNPATMQTNLDSSVSVVGIAYEAKAAADMGILAVVLMTVAISVSLGLMNLLPLPPLDGGKILVEFIQKIIRRDISPKVTNYLTIVGVVFVGFLFIYLLFQDIGHYVLGG